MAASSHVFTVQELLSLILSNLSVSEVASVLTVNHAFFEPGISIVWRELDSVAHLFAILDRPFTEAEGDFTPVTISIPRVISSEIKSRFTLYANRVRKVTNFRRSWVSRHVEWVGLENLVQPTAIATNIHTINYTWFGEFDGNASVHWLIIKLLLGPSTTSLTCFGANSRAGLAVEHAALLLKRALAVKSPLADLTLYTKMPTNDTEIASLVSHLFQFNCLTRLQLSVALINNELLDCIRHFPSLHTIAFSNPTEPSRSTRRSRWQSLSADSNSEGEMFPSLRSLAIRQVTCEDLESLFARYPSLLRGITKLDLHICEAGFGSLRTNSVTRVFQLLGNISHQLSDLTFAFPNNLQGYAVPMETLSSLYALNLERLTVHSAHLVAESCWSAELYRRWPGLRHLVIPYQRTGPLDFLELAKHEQLQVLCVYIRPPREDDLGVMTGQTTGSSAKGVRLESQCNLMDVPTETMRDLARFLLRCWPDVTLVWRNSAHRWPPSIQPPSRDGYDALANEINELRGGSV
ncbi:hypothetical protein FRC08_005458 [Ceratobasidium sp. 394]|nr:hypothetical protein FRC08_005458 [Ceratobasidium sp. 394]KAG9098573.1 hypothetical protein FS749_003516 [Ceratobasidium sp. UAMH 11750]